MGGPVFKTGEVEDLGLVGSIPIRLRKPPTNRSGQRLLSAVVYNIDSALHALDRSRFWARWKTAAATASPATRAAYAADQQVYDNTVSDGIE